MGNAVNVNSDLEFETIYSMETDIQANAHGSLRMDGILTERSWDDCISHGIIWERIQITDENDETLFSGIITSLEFEEGGHLRHVEISGLTESWLLAQERHNRVFQNPHITYGELLKYLSDRQHPIRMILEHNLELRTPLIQYHETDWEFLGRIGGRLGAAVIPGYRSDQYAACLGFPERKSGEYDLGQLQILSKRRVFVDTGKLKGRQKKTQGIYEHWKFSCQDNLELGDWVSRDGIRIQVFRKKAVFSGGMLRREYEAGPAASLGLPYTQNAFLSGLTLEGTVFSAEKEDIRLQFEMDALPNGKGSDLYPYPYNPETGNVFCSMPEPGTRVCLYFPDGKEEHGCIIHGKRAELDEFPDQNVKEFRGFHQKTMYMDPGSIKIHAHGEQTDSILSVNGPGTVELQSGNIQMKAKKDIHIYGRTCAVAAAKYISASQDGTENAMEMSGTGIAFCAERHIVSSAKRQGKTSTAMQGVETKDGGESMFNHVLGGIPTGPCSDYEKAVLGGIPDAVSSSPVRNIRSAIGRRIKRR